MTKILPEWGWSGWKRKVWKHTFGKNHRKNLSWDKLTDFIQKRTNFIKNWPIFDQKPFMVIKIVHFRKSLISCQFPVKFRLILTKMIIFDGFRLFLTKFADFWKNKYFWLFLYFVGNLLGLGFTQSQSSACLLLSASFICAVHTPSSRLFLQQYPSALWHLNYTVRTRFPIFTWRTRWYNF